MTNVNRRIGPTHPGTAPIDFDQRVAALDKTSPGISHIGTISSFRQLQLQLRSDIPVAVRQISWAIQGKPKDLLQLAQIAKRGNENFQQMLDIQLAGSRQTSLTPEAFAGAAWTEFQNDIAQSSNDETYLQNALVLLVGSVLDQITPEKDEKGTVKGLPRPLTERQAEYCVTQALHLLTQGPIAQKIHRIISEHGVKQSALSEPVWIAVTEMLADVDPAISGNWLAAHPDGQTDANRAILEVAVSVNRAYEMLQAEAAGDDTKAKELIADTKSHIAGTESGVEDVSRRENDRYATQELRRIIVRDRFQQSADAVLSMVVAAGGDKLVVDSGVDKEVKKILRDGRHVAAAMAAQGTKGSGTTEVKQQPPRLPIRMAIGPLPLLEEGQLRRAVSKTVCGELADLKPGEVVGKTSYQGLTMDKVLWQFSRKTGRDGKPMFEVGAKPGEKLRELEHYEVPLSQAMDDEITTLSNFLDSCHGNLGEFTDRTDLTRNERGAVLLVERVLKLARRATENDMIKYQARDRMVPLIMRLFLDKEHLDPVLQEAVDYSISVIGAAWPAEAIVPLVEQFAKIEASRPGAHYDMVDLGRKLGVIDPTSRFELGGKPIAGRKAELGSFERPNLVNPEAAALFADCQTRIVESWPALHPEDRPHRTIFRELSRLNIAYQVLRSTQRLGASADQKTLYDVAAMMSYLFPMDRGVQAVVTPILQAYSPTDQPEAQIKTMTFGDMVFVRPSETKISSPKSVQPQHVQALKSMVERVLAENSATGLLEGSLQVMWRLGSDKQIHEFEQALGHRLSVEIGPLLKGNEDVPLRLDEILGVTQRRLETIQTEIAAGIAGITKKEALTAFLMPEMRSSLIAIAGEQAALLDPIRTKLDDREKVVDKAVEEARGRLLLSVEDMLGNRPKREASIVQGMIATGLQSIAGGTGNIDMDSVLKLVPILLEGRKGAKGKKGKRSQNDIGEVISQLLTVAGAVGLGYPVAKGQQATAAVVSPVVSTVASGVTAEGKAMVAGDALAHADIASYFRDQMAVIQGVYNAKMAYIKAAQDALGSAELVALREPFQIITQQTQQQYTQLREGLTHMQNAMGTMMRLHGEIAEIRATEGEDTVRWTKMLKDELLPAILWLTRALYHTYQMQVSVEFPPVAELVSSSVTFKK